MSDAANKKTQVIPETLLCYPFYNKSRFTENVAGGWGIYQHVFLFLIVKVKDCGKEGYAK